MRAHHLAIRCGFALLYFVLLSPLFAQETVLFEDRFNGPCSPKWQFVGGDWAVVDGAFQLVESSSHYAMALLDLPLQGDFAIEMTFGGSVGVYTAYLSEDHYFEFFVDGSAAMWLRKLPGSQGEAIGSKYVSLSAKNVLRLEVRRNLVTANLNGAMGWEWATAVPRGKVGVRAFTNWYGRIYSFKVTQLGTPPASQTVTAGIPSPPAQAAAGSAPFAVDPRDIDRLARQLAAECRRREQGQQWMQQGAVAIATFDLVDISSPSVARNVAEDLYTSMTQAGFQLIERGQLDKVMKEMRIQTTDAIDSAQAQRLGSLTGASLILVGSISDRGNFVVVNARLLETRTGSAVAATRVEMRKVKIDR